MPYTGQSAQLQCVITIGRTVGVQADIRLLKDSVEVMGDSPRVTVGNVMTFFAGIVFQRSYDYSPISRVADSGSYVCEGTVSPASADLRPFVTNGTSSENPVVNIIGKCKL